MKRFLALAALAVAAPALGQTGGPAPALGQTSGPDYRQRANWAVFEGSGFASALPVGATPAAKHPKAAVFFIHPTTFKGGPGQMNQDVGDAAANQWADESSVARQASVFSGCCAVYSPRYRAAAYASFASPAVREAAFGLAYGDVERAFDAFLQAIGDRPFIIAGHSQGAFHAATLLEKRVEGTALQKRMVAAYIVGINLAQGEFGKRFKSVKPCERPAQTGCVVQWNSYLADADVAKFARLSQSTYVEKYGDDAGKETLCINPLTFDARRSDAGASAAKGAVPGSPGLGALQPLRAGAVAARCAQGLLLVTPDKALDLAPLPGGSMHYHDLGLFWADVRANAALRVAAFAKAGK
jgi:pimeloyl-ACP methyl ester carboxylesterase